MEKGGNFVECRRHEDCPGYGLGPTDSACCEGWSRERKQTLWALGIVRKSAEEGHGREVGTCGDVEKVPEKKTIDENKLQKTLNRCALACSVQRTPVSGTESWKEQQYI